MNRFDDSAGPTPQSLGWFEPTPKQVKEKLDAIRARGGENSAECAFLLMELGDAHMMQGRLSNPQAQESYEAALQIIRAQGDETPEVAWLYDKLANVKQSSGDTFGAQADLEKAMTIWKVHPPASALASNIPENYVARRAEDLQRLTRVNDFKNRKPPPI